MNLDAKILKKYWKLNLSMCKKKYRPWPSWIYSTDARLVQHLKLINAIHHVNKLKEKNCIILSIDAENALDTKKEGKEKICCKKNNRKQYCVGGGKIAVEDGNKFFKWGKKQNKVIDDGQKILFLGLATRSGRCHF